MLDNCEFGQYGTMKVILQFKNILQMKKKHIPISSHQEAEIDHQHSRNLLLKRFINLQRTIPHQSALTSRIALTISLLLELIAVVGYMVLAEHGWSSKVRNIVDGLRSQLFLLYTTEVGVYIAIIACFGLFLVATRLEKGSIGFNLTRNVMCYMPILSRALLFLTILLSYVNFWQNIIAQALSSLLVLTSTALLDNFLSKKQQNYQTSLSQSLVLDVSIILNLFANTIIVFQQSLTSLYTWSIVSGVISLVWYNYRGYQLYHHRFMAVILQVVIACKLSVTIQLAIVYMGRGRQHHFDFVQCVIAFVIVFFYLHLHANGQRFDINAAQYYLCAGRVKNLQLILYHILEEVDSNKQYLCIITGLIDQHSRKECHNINCWLKTQNKLDAVYGLTFSQTNYAKQKDTVCKYTKCIYQSVLSKNKTVDLILDYCEFITSEFDDFTSNILYVEQLSFHQNLGFLQQIRLQKLRYLMKEHSVSFNRHLFGGKMQLLQILDSQLHYNDVVILTKLFCEGNLHIWDSLMKHELDLSEIKQKLRENYQLIDQLTYKWRLLSHFFSVKKDWKRFYLLFKVYIKNQKIKNYDDSLEENAGEEEQDDHIYLNMSNGEQLMKPSFFFHKGSAILVTTLQNKQLTFVKTSQSFTTLTLYKQSEIKDNLLKIILPKELQPRHDDIVLNGLQKGTLNLETQYKIKNTHFLNKKQSKVPCVVFFKVYIDYQSSSQCCKFVGLLKRQTSVKMVTTLKEFHSEGMKSQKKLKSHNNKTFKSMKSLKNEGLVLDISQNIFIKQEDLQPAKHNKGVARIGLVFRLFTCVMIILLLLVCLFIYYETALQSETTLHWNYFLNLYRAPMNLIKNYLKIALNIGNHATNVLNARNAYAGLSSIMNSDQTLRFIFDFMDKQTLYPPYFPSIYNKNLSYDRFDIYYMVIQSLVTLSSSDKIDTKGYDFVQLNAYLKPAYDNMMNSTKLHFHYSLLSQFQKSTRNQTIFLISVIVICCIFFMLFYWNLKTHCENMDEVLRIIAHFTTKDIRGIVHYWKKIYKGFVEEQLKMEKQGIQQHLIASVKTINIIENHRGVTMILNQPQINLTTKQKTFASTKVEDKYFKLKVTIFLLMLLQIMPIISLIVYNLFQSKKLPDLQAAGFQLFRLYPTNTILGYALSQRYYSYVRPDQNTYNPDKFSDILSNLKIISQTDYLARGNPKSLFNIKLKNYFFAVLTAVNTTLAKCKSYSNQTLTTGIISYFRYVTAQITDYVQGRVNYTAMEMDALTAGVGLAGYYLIDAMQTWTDEFTGQLMKLQNINLQLLGIISLVILLLHFIAFECWLLSWLQNDYVLIRQIFSHLVPQDLLIREKLVRQKFLNTGILSY